MRPQVLLGVLSARVQNLKVVLSSLRVLQFVPWLLLYVNLAETVPHSTEIQFLTNFLGWDFAKQTCLDNSKAGVFPSSH